MISAGGISLTPATIAAGATVSRWVDCMLEYGDADVINIHAPSALDAGTYTIEVTPDDPRGTVTTVNTLQIGDPVNDAAPPAASKSRSYFELPAYRAFRIKGPSAAADRVFKLDKQIRVGGC